MYLPTTTFLSLALLHLVASHTVFTTLFVDDINQGDGVAIRMPMTPSTCTDPISSLTSNDMACGVDGSNGAAMVASANTSSKLTFEFREWADASQPGAIDISHKGPCAVYMKKVTDPTTDTAYGAGWFKIWDEGYDNVTKTWCTENLIANNGFLSVSIPADLAGGYYLVRPELLALQEASATPSDPQFYVGCAQLFLSSSGTTIPLYTVSIPGYVDADSPSMTFNIYEPFTSYPMFGPAVYISGQSATSSRRSRPIVPKSLVSRSTQTLGLVPDSCVLQNANWCGTELSAYTTTAGCWNASTICWEQAGTCYSSAPPTGSKNCPIWEAKCHDIEDACNAGNVNGPPDAGKVLTPPVAVVTDIPPPGTITTTAGSTATSQLTSTQTDPGTTTISTSKRLQNTMTALGLDTTTSSIASQATSHVSRPTPVPMASTAISSVTSASASGTASASGALRTSQDATCGAATGLTCQGSIFGDCCSHAFWCGSTSAYCGEGCQVGFGRCGMTSGADIQAVRRPRVRGGRE